MIRFFVVFMGLLLLLFVLELAMPVQRAVVIPWTDGLARVSAWLLRMVDSDVVATGKVLRDGQHGFAVSIEPGCNGVEAMIVYASALMAFPAPWSKRLVGLVAGFLAIQGLNLLRIISLFYLGQWDREWFDWAHLYIWQSLIMLDALVVFLFWLRSLPVGAPHHA